MPHPVLTLYRVNGSCAIVPHALLSHLSLPFTAVAMEPSPSTGALGSRYRAADGSLPHEDYLRINPTGYVPCLVVDHEEPEDGSSQTSVAEMPAVLNYISSLVPEKNLLGKTAIQKAKVAQWLAWLSGTLHSTGFGAYWRPERFAVGNEAKMEVHVRGREVIVKCFERIEERMGGKEFAVGDELTVVDFNLYVFFRWGVKIGMEMKALYPSYAKSAMMVEHLEAVGKVLEIEEQTRCFE